MTKSNRRRPPYALDTGLVDKIAGVSVPIMMCLFVVSVVTATIFRPHSDGWWAVVRWICLGAFPIIFAAEALLLLALLVRSLLRHQITTTRVSARRTVLFILAGGAVFGQNVVGYIPVAIAAGCLVIAMATPARRWARPPSYDLASGRYVDSGTPGTTAPATMSVDVVLVSLGAHKAPVIRAISELTGRDMQASWDLVRVLPATVLAGISPHQASPAMQALEAAGGQAIFSTPRQDR